jgi:hypothetical protein
MANGNPFEICHLPFDLLVGLPLVPSFKLYKVLEAWQQVAVHGFRSVKQGMDVSQQGGLRKPFRRFLKIDIAEAARHHLVRMLIGSERPHRLEKAEADLGQEFVPPIA